MIAPVDVAYRLTTGAELAAAADLVYTSIPGLNRAVVSEWFPPEHAKQPPTVVRTLIRPAEPVPQVDPDDEDWNRTYGTRDQGRDPHLPHGSSVGETRSASSERRCDA